MMQKIGVSSQGQKPNPKKCVLTLTDIARTDTGMHFAWQTSNPGEYPSYVHIGNSPVIGADGILYGRYETPDLASVPITPAGDKAEWTTEVAVPQDVKGLYILLSVESGKQRLYANYAVDVTDNYFVFQCKVFNPGEYKSPHRRAAPVGQRWHLIQQALAEWGKRKPYLALDTSMLWGEFCLIRIAVVYRGRAVPLV